MSATPPTTWTLESYFPTFDGSEYRTFYTDLQREIADARESAGSLGPLVDELVDDWAKLFSKWEDLQMRLGHLDSYLGCLGAADAANEDYQSASAATALLAAELTKFRTGLEGGLAGANDYAWDRLLAHQLTAGGAHTLEHLRTAGAHQMSAAEETLAADLGVNGLSAWSRLYDTVSGKMVWTMPWPDRRGDEVLSMSRRRALMSDQNREVRRAAFVAGNRAWKDAEDVAAAAINSLAGARLTLYGRRGQGHFLDQPMHDNAVQAETVHTMFATIAKNYEVPRRILRAGARLQGTERLAWYDLDAPRFASTTKVEWPEAVALCGGAFDATYPALGDYFRDTMERRWVESEQRPNKRSGAFCTGSSVTSEERIYMTFNDTMSDVNTLAHEFGHAWHSHLLGRLRPCAQSYPMTLAETASTFAETLLSHGLLADPTLTDDRRAFLIDQSTSHAPSYLLNIPVRFHFEERFYEERRAGIVTVSRLKTLMAEAQREVYGDTLSDEGTDPWFWASKLHFFIGELSFYNFPYTFGFLLSQALYAEYARQGPDFLPRYEAFLRLTGSATCEAAVNQALGRDLRDASFWAAGITALEPRIDQLEALIPR